MSGALADFEQLMLAELEVEAENSLKEIVQVEYQTTAKGTFHSSMRISQTAEKVTQGLVRYRQRVFSRWAEYMRPRLAALSASERANHVEAALSAMDRCIARMESIYNGRKPVAKVWGSGLTTVQSVARRERGLLSAELSLYATTPAPPSRAAVHVTTHGANSPVNVGSGSLSQSVVQPAEMSELAKALGDLLLAMDKHHRGAAADLRQIVEDAKSEAEKPYPNLLRLKAFLGASKDAIQTFAALNPAWDAARRIAQSLGLL